MMEFARVALASILLSATLVSQPQEQSSPQRKYAEEARKRAEQGDAQSQANLAFYYQIGSGVEQSDTEAAKWYRKAADQGNAGAQFQLGAIYAGAKVLTQDYAEAVRWYRKAAEQGQVLAQVRLAELYQQGEGVSQDYGKAVEWYRKAAEQGDPGAQFTLSGMYEDGKGVPQDYVEAHKWINLAVSRLPDSGPLLSDGTRRLMASSRDSLAAKMTAEQIAEAQRLAREWKPTKAK
jgi:TPR repeat protein